jgi:hypothetical protein
MKSISPRKNVRRGFQEDFGVGTCTDKGWQKASVTGSLKPVSLPLTNSRSNMRVEANERGELRAQKKEGV